jgi:hypothetical protein
MLAALLAAALLSTSARAATFVAYDGSFSIETPDSLNACDVRAFTPAKRPALCLEPTVYAGGPPALVILDAARSEVYDPAGSLEDFARRDLAMHQRKMAKSRFSALKPLKFRDDLQGYGWGTDAGGHAFDMFYFQLGGRKYYAWCRGDEQKNCYAALATVDAARAGAAAAADREPRFTPKALEGYALAVPPGWKVTRDEPKLFLVVAHDESFQIKVPLAQFLLGSDARSQAKGIAGGLKAVCPEPVEGPSPISKRDVSAATAQKGTFVYATCRNAREYDLAGVLDIGGLRRLIVATNQSQDPTARALAIVSNLAAAR